MEMPKTDHLSNRMFGVIRRRPHHSDRTRFMLASQVDFIS